MPQRVHHDDTQNNFRVVVDPEVDVVDNVVFVGAEIEGGVE